MANYWVVGASMDGIKLDREFVEQGVWVLGYDGGPQRKKASQIQSGDRIAIKRMQGKGRRNIRILHLGIVTGIPFRTLRKKQVGPQTEIFMCTVNWVATDLNRDIDFSAYQTVHGPYRQNDPGIQEIFCP